MPLLFLSSLILDFGSHRYAAAALTVAPLIPLAKLVATLRIHRVFVAVVFVVAVTVVVTVVAVVVLIVVVVVAFVATDPYGGDDSHPIFVFLVRTLSLARSRASLWGSTTVEGATF